MANQQLVSYIQSQVGRGISTDAIRSALLASGWSAELVDEAISAVSSGQVPPQKRTDLQNIESLIKDAWIIYKQRFGTLIAIHLIPTIILGLMAGILFGGIAIFKNVPTTSLSLIIGFAVLMAFSLLAFMIIFAWSQIALVYAIKDREENIGVMESFKRGWARIGRYFFASLMSSLAILGGLLLFIIPGIILAVRLGFARFISVFEEEHGLTALQKSREYARNIWWKIATRVLILSALSWGLSMASNTILSFFPRYVSFAAGAILIFLFAPYALIYSILLYLDVKDFKKNEAFTPSTGSKIGYVTLIILGILLPIVMVVVASFAFMKIQQFLTKQRSITTTTFNISIHASSTQATSSDSITTSSEPRIERGMNGEIHIQ